MNNVWVVSIVDYGDSCDGKSRVLGIFQTEEMAKDYVKQDIDNYIKLCEGVIDKVDYNKMCAWYDDVTGCEWNIESIKMDNVDVIDCKYIRSLLLKYHKHHSNGNISVNFDESYSSYNLLHDIESYMKWW